MKRGISLYSFSGDIQTGAMTVEDAIRYSAELGADGIEIVAEQHLPGWPNVSADRLLSIRRLCSELGLEIFCFSIYLNSLNRSDRPATDDEYVEMMRRGIAACMVLGTKIIRPAYFPKSPEHLASLVERCIPMLKDAGVVWAVELHAPFPPAFYTQTLEAVDSPWFRLIPDFSCWQKAGAAGHFQANDPSTLIPLLKWTVHIHAKGHTFDENGKEPNTPYKELIAILKEHGYEGSIVAESEGWIFNYHPTKEVTKTHFELLKRYIDAP